MTCCVNSLTPFATHASWSRPRDYRIREDQAYYKHVFDAYDLHAQGDTFLAIAQQLWPHEWNGQSKDPASHQALIQRARGHVKRARDLIQGREQK